jgi:hypothetical protein
MFRLIITFLSFGILAHFAVASDAMQRTAQYVTNSALDPSCLQHLQEDPLLDARQKQQVCMQVMEAHFLESFIAEGLSFTDDPNIDGLFAASLASQVVQVNTPSLLGVALEL